MAKYTVECRRILQDTTLYQVEAGSRSEALHKLRRHLYRNLPGYRQSREEDYTRDIEWLGLDGSGVRQISESPMRANPQTGTKTDG